MIDSLQDKTIRDFKVEAKDQMDSFCSRFWIKACYTWYTADLGILKTVFCPEAPPEQENFDLSPSLRSYTVSNCLFLYQIQIFPHEANLGLDFIICSSS
ncbi:hypothetical protein DSO57_1026361 [Entomophthora muscae]|uniref:Uncharacterized protein n=1 Tax=Entomophthora muscae TaxID=34485 RepID=A0ACC2SEM6_9FUNG|nr:hypothetical protein DSO57_1026361 [Entomophthora muscae]